MRIDPLDFPQARMAPESVMRGLEELDPTACVVHLGGSHWSVGKVRYSSVARGIAEQMLDNWTANVSAGARLSHQGKVRVRFAQLTMLGFRTVQQYRIKDVDSRIVRDFERSRWLWLHTSENEFWRRIDATDERDAARAQISNPDLAKDAWRYAFTRSHMPSASLTPDLGPKAGWSRHVA